MKLEGLQRDWDSIANFDALWGVLSEGDKIGGKWDENEFFQTGREEIKTLIDKIKAIGADLKWTNALDFGCGVGRLTQAMANYFEHCYGVDVSDKMIEFANKYNRFREKCIYTVNHSEELSMFSSDFFDFSYSTITFQHMAKHHILKYLVDLIRTLKPGGISVFQLPSYLPVLYRLQPRRRIYALLRRLGVPERFLFTKLRLSPIRMTFIDEKELENFVKKSGGNVLKIDSTKFGNGIVSNVYFVTK